MSPVEASGAGGGAASWIHDGRLRVITLPGAQERQRRIMHWGSLHGIGSEVFHHGTGPHPPRPPSSPANPLTRARYGRDHLQPGELGCLSSHRQLYQRLVAEDQPWCLVLEDDVSPCRPDWPARVGELVERIRCSRLLDRPWVCHLGLSTEVLRRLALRPLRWRKPEGFPAPVTEIGELDPSIGSIWTTHAYLISRKAARRILRWEPEDAYVADDWDQRLRSGILHPLLATSAPLFLPDPLHPSQIGQRTEFPPSAAVLRWSPASLVYRLNRKARTLIYRARLLPVRY